MVLNRIVISVAVILILGAINAASKIDSNPLPLKSSLPALKVTTVASSMQAMEEVCKQDNYKHCYTDLSPKEFQ